MAYRMLESSAISAFCESLAVMYAAGIQMDEAVHLLSDNMESTSFKRACDSVYPCLLNGETLTHSLEESKAFPQHMIDMVRAGEQSGRLEPVLHSLAEYYDEEDRLFAKLRSAVAYPAALLTVMSVILIFTVAVILPVFVGVYNSLSGSLAVSSFSFVNASIVIGWVALVLTLVCTLAVLVGMAISRGDGGHERLLHIFEKIPFMKKPMHQLAVSRFTSALATFTAAGIDTDTAMRRAIDMCSHVVLKAELERAYAEMSDPTKAKSLAQAIYDNNIFEPLYARMLIVGTRSGSLQETLTELSDTFFTDAIVRIDRAIDSVEPTLAALLTIGVGATLIAVMLPLIGIMGSIG